MIVRGAEGLWRVEGVVKVDSAAALFGEAEAMWQDPELRVDLSGISEADSAVIALLLAWRRRALAEGREIEFLNATESVRSLATLYDVAQLLFPSEAEAKLALSS